MLFAGSRWGKFVSVWLVTGIGAIALTFPLTSIAETIDIAGDQLAEVDRSKSKTGKRESRESRKERKKREAEEAAALKQRPQFPHAPEVEFDEVINYARRARSLYDGLVLPTEQFGPWVVAHALLGVGDTLRVLPATTPGQKAEPVSAVSWFASGARYKGYPAFSVTPFGARGNLYAEGMPVPLGALEGHPNQFLGYLSELKLPLDTKWMAFSTEKREWQTLTLGAVLEDAKSQAGINPQPGTILEHTWTLWALANYADPDLSWKNANAEAWSIEKLIDFETRQGITEDTSCAGNHRLYALYLAVQKYVNKHGVLPTGGTHARAWQLVSSYARQAQQWQNADGSFSGGNHLQARLANSWSERLAADGHILEFLVDFLPDQRLKEPWLLRAVYTVASDLLETRAQSMVAEPAAWGGVYHALHALRVYEARTTKTP